ncbi:MAG: branched-chain amino acid aminotransferase [Alphaproteobacteria bacterium]|nr:branched-chain amino acid aminotransferase [Alphaproteobacteria bacterium]
MAMLPYDDRDGFIWIDGKMTPWREAKVHFLTNTLQYGSGVFEGIRAYNGNIFKLREHVLRLIEGCKIMDMRLPYTEEEVSNACLESVKINKISNGYLRPLVWHGTDDVGISTHNIKTHLGIATWEWPSYFSVADHEKGISLKTSPWRRPPAECAPVHAKACGLYMISTLSKHNAENAGYTDSLMLDYRGRVAELSIANFFTVKNGELHTPEPGCFLAGITRSTVIDLAKKNGIKVYERVIMPEELKDMDECFATGTASEITPIGKIDDIIYKPGPVTKLLKAEYKKLVRMPSDTL